MIFNLLIETKRLSKIMKFPKNMCNKSGQKGMSLIETIIVIAIGGIIFSLVFVMAMGVMDRARATNDSKTFLTLTADIFTFLGPGRLVDAPNVATGLAPSHMVVTTTTAASGGVAASSSSALVNSHGGSVAVTFSTPNMIITSRGYSKEGCIKLVEMAATSFSAIWVGDSGSAATVMSSQSGETYDPVIVLERCTGTDREIQLRIH